jgi:hypothetical protein
MNRKRSLAGACLAAVTAVLAVLLTGSGVAAAPREDANAQLAKLSQLQAAFHRATTVRNPDTGDAPDVIDRRVKQMLSLWAADGSVTLMTVTPAREFKGKGELGTSSCAPGSNTLCDLWKNVAGAFQPQNRFVSLAPAYKTRFEIHGDTATVYFECHYFNVDPTRADRPLWKDMAHLVFDGTAKKVDGQWRFDHANTVVASVPLPY